MALPVNHVLNEQTISSSVASVSSTSVVYVRAPFRGKIVKVGTTLSTSSATADATVTTSIAGTNITGGVVTITQSGSAAGLTSTAVPTAVNTCNEDDYIGFTFSGSGTSGGPVTCWAVIRAI